MRGRFLFRCFACLEPQTPLCGEPFPTSAVTAPAGRVLGHPHSLNSPVASTPATDACLSLTSSSVFAFHLREFALPVKAHKNASILYNNKFDQTCQTPPIDYRLDRSRWIHGDRATACARVRSRRPRVAAWLCGDDGQQDSPAGCADRASDSITATSTVR